MSIKLRFFWGHSKERITSIRCFEFAVFSFLLFSNYSFPNDYISLVLTFASCVLLLTCAKDDVLPYALFFASFAYLFRFTQWNLYILIQGCFILRSIMMDTRRTGYLLVSFFYVLFHLISSEPSSLRIGSFIPFVAMISITYATSLFDETQRSKCLQYYLYGFLMSSVLGIFERNTRLDTIFDINPIRVGSGLLMQRFGGLMPDCNFYTLISVVMICLVVFNYGDEMNKISRVVYLVILLALGALTFSKSFYICFAIIIVFLAFFSEKRTKKFAIGVILFGGVLYFFFSEKVNIVFNASIGRIFTTTTDMNSFTNGRYNYWIAYLNDYKSSFFSILFGKGTEALLDGHIIAHNTFIEVLYKYGAVGLLVDILFFIYNFSVFDTRGRFRFDNLLPLFLLLLTTFNLSAYSFYPLWSCFFVVMVVLKGKIFEAASDSQSFSFEIDDGK